MATAAIESGDARSRAGKPEDSRALVGYFWATGLAGLLAIGIVVQRDWSPGRSLTRVLLWAATAAVGDYLVVRFDRGVSLTMSLPVTLAAAIVLSPGEAALVGFLGSADPQEWRRQSSAARMLFNRAQVGVAAGAAGVLLTWLSADVFEWPAVLGLALIALTVDFVVNALFVVPAVMIRFREPAPRVVRSMFGHEPAPTALLYVSMGLVAPLIALSWSVVGAWGLVVSLVPLAVARVALLRTEILNLAGKRLEDKDEALRRIQDRLQDERRDERIALAGELHDEVLPAIFKVHLMGQVLREDLSAGRLLDLDADLPELLAAAEFVSRKTREVVNGLLHSPVGPRGLASALRLLIQTYESAGAPKIEVDLTEVRASSGAQLTAYLVA
jgi:signal transduction histidine kinase